MTHPRPHSRRELFIAFTLIALQGFGGVLAVIQRELVERKQWLGHDEFLETWGIAQILPGSNMVNLSLIVGYRYFGATGALTALGGLLAAPLVILVMLLTLLTLLQELPDNSILDGALRGMGAVASGLIAGTALKMVHRLRSNIMGPLACAVLILLVFIAVGIFRLPLIGVVLACGIPACLWAFIRTRSNAA